ncbi:thiolase family protein [Vibrio mediterranei]|uniref:thiolase family protein n=1 Tax=Vibrio mediterranei TaxID=689 RepID=UPI0040686996
MSQREVWIVAAKRTPIGKFQGKLAPVEATTLGSAAISAVMKITGIDASLVDEVLMGCVLTAGCRQAPARQAALGAGLPDSIPCTTINKVCGSGMKTVMLASTLIRSGEMNCVIAGGMESMTNAPYLLPQAREGIRIGHSTCFDHMFLDGLQDAYEGHLMGMYGQQIADQLAFSREQMDEWAVLSARRAMAAQLRGAFEAEMCRISVDNTVLLEADELPQSINIEKIPRLKPAFSPNGSITAANSSAISDGAAALILMEKQMALSLGLKPLAKIKGQTTAARKPSEFTLAPVNAIDDLLDKVGWSAHQVDGWEINEAFAVTTQIAMQQLNLDPVKVNVNGGACALGHPIGASGSRILVTLVHSLMSQKSNCSLGDKPLRGVAALCIGGGEATAIAIEIPV